MKRIVLCATAVLVTLAFTADVHAAVQYVKLCVGSDGNATFGEGFFYLPGTDACYNPENGDTRQLVNDPFTGDIRVFRTILPYPEGKWTTKNPQAECAPAKAVKLGTYKSTDFVLNHYGKAETPPFRLAMKKGEFISKVIMNGGFYDPRVSLNRSGINSSDALCVRSTDPTVLEKDGATLTNPLYGNGGIPVGCIARSRITGMPAEYVIDATAAYQNVDMYFNDAAQTDLAGPYTYGTSLVVTTDYGYKAPPAAPPGGFLVYVDSSGPEPVLRPLAGAVTVNVCVASGLP